MFYSSYTAAIPQQFSVKDLLIIQNLEFSSDCLTFIIQILSFYEDCEYILLGHLRNQNS